MRPAFALVLLLAAAPVWAEGPATSGGSPSTAPAKEKETKKQRKVIRLDAITVEGHIQKPEAFYILPRSNLNFDELNKPESFVPKVVKSVEKEPF